MNKVLFSQNNGALKSQNIFQLRLDYHDKLKGKHGYGIFFAIHEPANPASETKLFLQFQ